VPIIEEVAFSRLVVGGKVYRSATIVYPHSVDGRWWRKDGMKFLPEDFDHVIAQKPQVVVLGIGFSAKVSVPEETKQRFSKEGILCIVADTPEAVKQFNAMQKTRTVIGAFHLM
jgi:hypothetical protein